MDAPQNKTIDASENKFLNFIRSFLFVLLFAGIIVGSFWLSFLLGKKLLAPARKIARPKIQVNIPEPPPSLAPLQASKEVTTTTLAPIRTEPRCAAGPQAKPNAAKAADRYFKLQAGLFISKASAEELARRISEAGADVFLRKVNMGWRVQVGAFNRRSKAQESQNILKDKGIDSVIIVE